MLNTKYIHRMMKNTLENHGFEMMERPIKALHPDVIGVHDEHTIFLPTNKKTSEKWDDSFIVFTFNSLLVYQREDFRDRCMENLYYENEKELLRILYFYAKIKDGWKEETFARAKEYLHERYEACIKKEGDTHVELSLPYNHTTSNEQRLFVYDTAVALEVFRGSDYTGKWETIRTKDYRTMDEFLEAMDSFYQPKNMWTDNN